MIFSFGFQNQRSVEHHSHFCSEPILAEQEFQFCMLGQSLAKLAVRKEK